jgi:hypothetical protein
MFPTHHWKQAISYPLMGSGRQNDERSVAISLWRDVVGPARARHDKES